MEEEIWKDINGYEGFYQISNFGHVKSLPRVVNKTYNGVIRPYRQKEVIRKPNIIGRGYLAVGLNLNDKQKNTLVHQLVALHFIPNPENKPTVNHKDGNKKNNNYTNLEWATYSENNKHAFTLGLRIPSKTMLGKFGKLNPNSRPIITEGLKFDSISEAGRYFNVSASAIIQSIKTGGRCGKRKWEYA